MPIDFTAIDFETANSSSASACQVGLVRVRGGAVVEREDWLIKPPEQHATFEPFNVHLHGVSEAMTRGAERWEEQLPRLLDFVGSDVVVAHNAGFDMGVIRASCSVTVQPTPKFKYLCSVQVSRKTYDIPSHSLPFAAAEAGFTEFQHHNALADAEACAAIIVDAAARAEAPDVTTLAKTLGLKLATLKAIPLKL
ncbi:3'-5' exoribonuclease [Leucobacter sp. UCMA 4100]|uniref:exonuclease domain-containing protein n=1 Tax=Leucobacter sp. UCMA 4100 TaxID=2810534 RepID=UPI0022EB5DB2|nr:exonuclease domain-containing protein [Leucobacter sp. UCMA 4100]MDA3147546.1 3'-5' exoribonuclease [Leucobacter sp. UCMA 4100]